MGRSRFDAVLFDWCGTLVEYPTIDMRLRGVLRNLGWTVEDEVVTALVDSLDAAARHPSVIEADRSADLSAESHSASKMLLCEVAGVEVELAHAIDASCDDLPTYRSYPEVVDVVNQLAASGVKLALVSDFHVDLRPYFEAHGILQHFAGVVLSCEMGVVKPDSAMFAAALDAVATQPERCLMVGDNPHPDCGAAALGIATLILPVQRHARLPLLNRVLDLVI